MIRWASFGVVVGLVLLIVTFNHTLIGGGIGFLIMLGCLLVIERNVRKLGRAGLQTLSGGLRASGGLRGVLGEQGLAWGGRLPRRDASLTRRGATPLGMRGGLRA